MLNNGNIYNILILNQFVNEVKKMIKEGKIERTIISQVWKNVNINNAIRKAIEDGEMKVFYQPKVEAGSTRVVGAEALIRRLHCTKKESAARLMQKEINIWEKGFYNEN